MCFLRRPVLCVWNSETGTGFYPEKSTVSWNSGSILSPLIRTPKVVSSGRIDSSMEDFRKAQEVIEKREENPITQKTFRVV